VVEVSDTAPGANVRGATTTMPPERSRSGRARAWARPSSGWRPAFGLAQIEFEGARVITALVTATELVSAPAPLGFGQRYDSKRRAPRQRFAPSMARRVACCARRRHRRDREPSARGRRDVGSADHDRRRVGGRGRSPAGGRAPPRARRVPQAAAAPRHAGVVRAIADTPLFALPGNPASVYATFVALVRPALAALCACAALDPAPFEVQLAAPCEKRHTRLELRRGRLERGAGGVLRRIRTAC
jgi:molybdopterin molybdotransferase